MARRLGAWDCSYCPNKRILGNVFDCPGCGHPRPRGVRFYSIPDGPVVTPEIAKMLGSGGPNWYCEFCDSGNKDDNEKCWNCGAERGSAPSHEVKDYKQGEEPNNAEEAAKADDDNKSWVPIIPIISKAFSRRDDAWQEALVRNEGDSDSDSSDLFRRGLTIFGTLVGLSLVVFLIYQFFFNTREVAVRVSQFNWSQNVVVHEFQIVHDSSWSTHPSDAYNITESWMDTRQDMKVHDGWETVEYQDTCYETESYTDTCTESVYVSDTCTGTRDNGDGSFETYDYECGSYETETYSCTKTREVPYSCTKTRQEEIYHYEDIYDWFYTYDVDRWVTIHEYPTSGTDHNPYFFTVTLNNPYTEGSPKLGQQQKIEQRGTYQVTFFCEKNVKVGDGGYFTRLYSYEEWMRWRTDTDYIVEINAFNTILSDPQP